MIDSEVFAMDTILNEVCVLVTVAFALTLVPCLQRTERSLLSLRDQITALQVFVFLGLVEEATVSHAGLLNERIVGVCAAGLLAGPWVGLAVGVFVTWLALVLLRRCLQGLFGSSFRLVVRSEIGEGTTVTICIPLRKQLGVGQESRGSIAKNRWVPELPGMR